MIEVPPDVLECMVDTVLKEYNITTTVSQVRVLRLVGMLNDLCKQETRLMEESIAALEMEKRFLQAYVLGNSRVE